MILLKESRLSEGTIALTSKTHKVFGVTIGRMREGWYNLASSCLFYEVLIVT